MSSERPGGPADVFPGDLTRETTRHGRREPSRVGDRRRPSRRPRREREAKKGSLLRELPVLLLVAFVLALVVKTFFVQAFFIPSGSMEQTLHGCPGCTGDRVLVNKVPYWFGEPEPGDIVVFKGPDTWTPEVDVAEPGNWFTGALLWLGRTVGVAPPSEDDFVKRVIATDGQTVAVLRRRGPGHRRRRAARRALHLREHPDRAAASFGPVTVPEGRLWVMGDHRSASADSNAAHGRPVLGHDRRGRRHRQGRADRLAGEPVRRRSTRPTSRAPRRPPQVWPCRASPGPPSRRSPSARLAPSALVAAGAVRGASARRLTRPPSAP